MAGVTQKGKSWYKINLVHATLAEMDESGIIREMIGDVEIEAEPASLLKAACKIDIPTLENGDVGLLDALAVYAPKPDVFMSECLDEQRRRPRHANRGR